LHLQGAFPANADSWRELPHDGKEMEDQTEVPPCDTFENRQRMLVLLSLSNIDNHLIQCEALSLVDNDSPG